MSPRWTDERIALLTKMRGNGISFGKIANAVGLSRNACIGKAQRLGLAVPVKESRERKLRPRQSTIRIKATPREQRNMDTIGALAPDLDVLRLFDERPAPATFLGIPLLSLRDGQCRFPRGEGAETLFCGQPAADGSYCQACHARCYVRPMQLSDAERERRRQQVRNMRRRAA